MTCDDVTQCSYFNLSDAGKCVLCKLVQKCSDMDLIGKN
jgi:hypothetical protein